MGGKRERCMPGGIVARLLLASDGRIASANAEVNQ